MSRWKIASVALVLFGVGIYCGYSIYGRNEGKHWATRAVAVVLMAKAGGEAKETWMLAEIVKGFDARPQQQNREYICKLILLKASAIKKEHLSYLSDRKGVNIPALSPVDDMYAKDVAGAEAAAKHSGCAM